MAGGGGTGRALLSLSHSLSSSSSLLFSRSILFSVKRPISFPLSHCFHRTLCLSATAVDTDQSVQPLRHAILLDRIRSRQLKDSPTSIASPAVVRHGGEGGKKGKEESKGVGAKKAETFEELGLSEEVLGAVKEMGISAPTEIQSIGVPAVLDGKSVVLGSHTGSGKTLAYLLPLVQEVSCLNRALTSFANAGDFVSAKEVFDGMRERDVVSWNSMMSAYTCNGKYDEVLRSFQEMLQHGFVPSVTSFSISLTSCARSSSLTYGRLLHGLSIKRVLL